MSDAKHTPLDARLRYVAATINATESAIRTEHPEWALRMRIAEESIVQARLDAAGLLEACKGLLEQVTGPAMVYGDGRGNDGKKTGLSHEEFNTLRNNRIAKARAAIAKAANGS